MNAQLERPRRTGSPKSAPKVRQHEQRDRALLLKAALKVVVLLLLGGLMLFAHGCHGDEDNELFGVLRAIVGD